MEERTVDDGDPLVIAGESFGSRLLLGTARYPSQRVLLEALRAGGCEMVTVSMRRIALNGTDADIVDLLSGYRLLPNTAGCATAKDAVFTAELARESLGTNWVKLEVIGNADTLYPDIPGLLEATRGLVRRGFVVLPYCNDDPAVCRQLTELGAAAVMPMGSMIGSGHGIGNPGNIELICRQSAVPVILDAGIGTASDAVIALELGCSAVLINTAVAGAGDPVRMAASMALAVRAGRLANLAQRIPRRDRAYASSPQTDLAATVHQA
ncbi:MAG: thiazole synthase [Pirellulaceae bacterium]